MAFKCPFQPKPFCNSVIISNEGSHLRAQGIFIPRERRREGGKTNFKGLHFFFMITRKKIFCQ